MLSHRCLMLQGTDRDDEHLNIFLEFVPGGSIASLLTKFGMLLVEHPITQYVSRKQQDLHAAACQLQQVTVALSAWICPGLGSPSMELSVNSCHLKQAASDLGVRAPDPAGRRCGQVLKQGFPVCAPTTRKPTSTIFTQAASRRA